MAIYGSMTMTNTILAENYDKGNEDPDCYGPISSGDYNLLGIGDSPGCTFSAQTHNLVGTTASPLDPQLGIFKGDHGGPTETMPIKVSGPAGDQIPAGVNGCVAGTKDQRGFVRFPPCDIGAYEVDQSEHVYIPMVSMD